LRRGETSHPPRLVSTALRFWAALRIPIPWIAPDELIYAELGRSLYASGSLEILGEPTAFYGLITPALVGLPLSLGDVGLGYGLLKLVQALVMSLAAVPVFLWARTLASEGWALVAAALTVAVPGLAYSGLIMTEVAFYPAFALAAWLMARALLKPTAMAQGLVLAAVVLTSLVRLQAAVLLPAFVTAVALMYGWRKRSRDLLAFWPTVAGTGVLGAAWAAWQLREGGPATRLLGAYQAAGEVDYGVADAVRYTVYHAADIVLFTGVLPVCAAVVLASRPAKTPELRAYLAVTVSVAGWMTLVVGLFASRHVGHLAERNLFALAPVLFVGLAAWLALGAPRPRLATALATLGAVALVVALPVDRFVSLATIPDSFTLIPLHRLEVRAPGLDEEFVLVAAVALAALAFALVPRRRIWVLPAALLMALAAASVSASRVVAAQATLTQPGTVGSEARWVDRAPAGPSVYLYTGDVFWNSVWETIFWNHRVRRVYDLLDAQVPGPLPQPSVGPLEDGRLVDKTGAEVPARFVVASDSLQFVGERVADGGNSIALWRLDPPFRLAQWIQNVRFDGTVERHARVVVYACRGGALELQILAEEPRTIELVRNGRAYRRRRLSALASWAITIPAVARRPLGTRICSFDVITDGPIRVHRIAFVGGRD
jgi:hypothetical protein